MQGMQKRGPDECIGNYSPQLVSGCGYWFWHSLGSISYTKASMSHLLSETARSAHCVHRCKSLMSLKHPEMLELSVSEAFLGVVYGER